jgi:hypothetical protein
MSTSGMPARSFGSGKARPVAGFCEMTVYSNSWAGASTGYCATAVPVQHASFGPKGGPDSVVGDGAVGLRDPGFEGREVDAEQINPHRRVPAMLEL